MALTTASMAMLIDIDVPRHCQSSCVPCLALATVSVPLLIGIDIGLHGIVAKPPVCNAFPSDTTAMIYHCSASGVPCLALATASVPQLIDIDMLCYFPSLLHDML